MESSSTTSGANGSTIVSEHRMKRIENPFSLKVGQVFTGFGVGCGLGIGVGRPLNLGAIPMLSQIMSATRGATDAFSGVGRHVNTSLRKLGVASIEAGIGCGVGFGHGFGVGIALKPGVVHQVQSFLAKSMAKMMMIKFGVVPNLPVGQGVLPSSLSRGMSLVNEPSNPIRKIMQFGTKVTDDISKGGLPGDQVLHKVSTYENVASRSPGQDASYQSRTENVINSFLNNPVLKNEEGERNGLAGSLQLENNVLQMVLKHQQAIEKLMEENEKLRRILVEDLKIPTAKLEAGILNSYKSPCTECFDCRRRQRKR